MTVLVLGGAGYIGSHMVQFLKDNNTSCVVVDDLSTGFRESVTDVPFYQGDIADDGLISNIIKDHRISSVMHFAAFSQVGESVSDPALYYGNNVAKTLKLLKTLRTSGVDQFVFSSTAAVYGVPIAKVIDEQHRIHPINPYGRSKIALEWALQDYCAAYGMKAISLRYFNAAGACPSASNGERHNPETHLIPLVLQAASGRRASISVFGDDYDTLDGTCIRDYIHVQDLAQAHLLALSRLENMALGSYEVFNLGNGEGYTVRDVIDTAKRISGRNISVVNAPRRLGDPDILVASSKHAQDVLGWQPEFTSLEQIIDHAWAWEKVMASS